jgi:hypothetical protein
MSYRCHFCTNPSEPGEKLTLVVVEVRPFGDYGTQIARERNACPRCAPAVIQMPPIKLAADHPLELVQ